MVACCTQVLLSQVHRLRALVLLGRFLDMGSWAVDLALSVGIFPYVLKLLQTTAADLRTTLVFIWTKILALDKSCQVCFRKRVASGLPKFACPSLVVQECILIRCHTSNHGCVQTIALHRIGICTCPRTSVVDADMPDRSRYRGWLSPASFQQHHQHAVTALLMAASTSQGKNISPG